MPENKCSTCEHEYAEKKLTAGQQWAATNRSFKCPIPGNSCPFRIGHAPAICNACRPVVADIIDAFRAEQAKEPEQPKEQPSASPLGGSVFMEAYVETLGYTNFRPKIPYDKDILAMWISALEAANLAINVPDMPLEQLRIGRQAIDRLIAEAKEEGK